MGRFLNLLLSLALWRNYKTLILSSALLAVCLYAVSGLQSGYIESQLAEKQLNPDYAPPLSITGSLYLKWLAYTILVALWFAYNRWRNHLGRIREANAALSHLLARKPARTERDGPRVQAPGADPFARIRTKETLRTEADLVIERKR